MKIYLSLAVLLISGTNLSAQQCHESGNEVHGMAPIGVMAGHTHSKGHLMASYRYMPMHMQNISRKGSMLSETHVLSSYMMAPESMQMDMHMIGLMYAPLDRLTISVMANYNQIKMSMASYSNHSTEMTDEHSIHGSEMEMTPEINITTMQNDGFGDIRVAGLYRIIVDSVHCLHAIVGATIPTGGIDAGDAMHPAFPYPMQNGTGSFSSVLGLNYSWLTSHYLLGAQALHSAPLHKNTRGYMGSIKYESSVWAARKWTTWFSSSIRIRGSYQSAIRGSDPLINEMMSPMGVPLNNEYGLVEVIPGLNFKPAKRWRIAAEVGVPAVQWNKGMAMNRKWTATIGLQCVFL